MSLQDKLDHTVKRRYPSSKLIPTPLYYINLCSIVWKCTGRLCTNTTVFFFYYFYSKTSCHYPISRRGFDFGLLKSSLIRTRAFVGLRLCKGGRDKQWRKTPIIQRPQNGDEKRSGVGMGRENPRSWRSITTLHPVPSPSLSLSFDLVMAPIV